MKYLFAVFLCGLIIIFLTSCKEKEFRNELAFVKKLMDNPENFEEIVSSSEFYDSRYFDVSKNKESIVWIKSFLQSKKISKVKVDYVDTNIQGISLKNVKSVILKIDEFPYSLYFNFYNFEGKIVLMSITQVY